jgi:hypothetical protein
MALLSKSSKWGAVLGKVIPLLPFLFNIVAEGLFVLFQRATALNIFWGIDFGSNNFLSHLQYPDDTLVFMPASLHTL